MKDESIFDGVIDWSEDGEQYRAVSRDNQYFDVSRLVGSEYHKFATVRVKIQRQKRITPKMISVALAEQCAE